MKVPLQKRSSATSDISLAFCVQKTYSQFHKIHVLPLWHVGNETEQQHHAMKDNSGSGRNCMTWILLTS